MSAERLQDEFKSIFLDDTDFSESITYNVLGVTPVIISAVVERNIPKQFPQHGDRNASSFQTVYDIQIEISKNATDGISLVTINQDTVLVSLNISGAPSEWRVAGIIFQDLSVWKLGLRK